MKHLNLLIYRDATMDDIRDSKQMTIYRTRLDMYHDTFLYQIDQINYQIKNLFSKQNYIKYYWWSSTAEKYINSLLQGFLVTSLLIFLIVYAILVE